MNERMKEGANVHTDGVKRSLLELPVTANNSQTLMLPIIMGLLPKPDNRKKTFQTDVQTDEWTNRRSDLVTT